MYILGFETTGNIGTVALLNMESGEIRLKESAEPMSHLKNMAPLAEELIREELGDYSFDLLKKNLAAVACSIGPGSFTGIRIGVTTARAMAQALDIPGISVPTLETFRLRCSGSPVVAILNARRNQVYGGVFDGEGNDILTPGPYMLNQVLEVADKLDEPIFYGDGVDAYEDQLEGRVFAPEQERYQTADLVVRIAEAKFRDGDTVDYGSLLPDYMRLAEAEQKLRDGKL